MYSTFVDAHTHCLTVLPIVLSHHCLLAAASAVQIRTPTEHSVSRLVDCSVRELSENWK